MSTIAENIREYLNREPFQPFRLVTTSGKEYEVKNQNSAALLRSEVFVVLPDGDQWAHVPFLHIASIETIRNGRGPQRGRRRKNEP